MKSQSVRIGVVGYGRIAESAHLPAWLAIPNCQVVAIADHCEERRAAARRQWPAAHISSSCQDLLEAESIDCLDICTPPHDHTPSILAGCAHHVPRIICEKPLTASPHEYALIAEAQARTGSQVYTINSWLQSDLHRVVSGVLDAETIGEVRSVTLRTLRPDCALGVHCWQPRWRTDPAYAGGGIVLDHGWHQLYLMAHWIGADPLALEASLHTVQARHAPVEDQATLDLEFPNASGRIELSWASQARCNDGEIIGSRGSIQIRDEGLSVYTGAGEQVHLYGERLSDSSYHPEWFTALFTNILADESHIEGTRNLREARMLLDTLFSAYRRPDVAVARSA